MAKITSFLVSAVLVATMANASIVNSALKGDTIKLSSN
jgi:hypothetical protein